MADLATLVSGIDFKVQKLIDRLETLQRENEVSRNEVHGLNQVNREQQWTIDELNQQIIQLKTTQHNNVNEGTVEAKATIDELLREINKCIGLLNR